MILFGSFKALSVFLFGWIADKFPKEFELVKAGLEKSDIKILYRTWVALSAFIGVVAIFGAAVVLLLISLILQLDFFLTILLTTIIPACVGISMFFVVCFYPHIKAGARKRSIEANLPFALNHMAAIASSGVPTETMFKLLTGFEEYEEISREAKKIVRNIETFGMSVSASISEVVARTPSKDLKEVLEGINSTLESGGDLKQYLKIQSNEALFNYKIKRSKYSELLSTYADFYTALLIAAPLFLVAVLAVLNMMGGQIYGLDIQFLMNLGIFVLLPVLNIIFILFVHLTQPSI